MSATAFNAAKHALKLGEEYPYDCPDSGKAKPARDWAHSAARGILSDLNDRRGIKHGFLDVDEDVRADMVEALSDIVRAAWNRCAPAAQAGAPLTEKQIARMWLRHGGGGIVEFVRAIEARIHSQRESAS